jgi:hypothetical protein
MEHGVSLMALARVVLLTLCLLGASRPSAATEQNLVLVASAQSPITSLSLAEARKIYLGVPIRVGDKMIQPLRNASDPLLVEVFMQRVMYMASETYERQILNRLFRLGGERPRHFDEARDLTAALYSNPWAITYMWRDVALSTPGIKIVGWSYADSQ